MNTHFTHRAFTGTPWSPPHQRSFQHEQSALTLAPTFSGDLCTTSSWTNIDINTTICLGTFEVSQVINQYSATFDHHPVFIRDLHTTSSIKVIRPTTLHFLLLALTTPFARIYKKWPIIETNGPPPNPDMQKHSDSAEWKTLDEIFSLQYSQLKTVLPVTTIMYYIYAIYRHIRFFGIHWGLHIWSN